jgi:hypothetical protein
VASALINLLEAEKTQNRDDIAARQRPKFWHRRRVQARYWR